MPALAIWAVATVLSAWSPFRFALPDPPFWQRACWYRFGRISAAAMLEDLTDVIGQAIVFVPLGALLAAHSWRQTFRELSSFGFGAGSCSNLAR